MSEITEAIKAKQTQITQLQSDIETLQRAAGIMGGRAGTTAKATTRSRATTNSPAKPSTKRKRRPWSAAARKAMSKKVKASWAKRKRAGG